MHEKATQFEILNRVDAGGMAEIFRARNAMTGEIMAIKRILPSLVGQAEFVKMFIDEAGVCLTLKHPNIVRVDQIGMMDNSLFMSMEFVDGTNLREVLSFANQYKFTLPVHESVRIAVCVLDGLQYAHVHVSDKGEPLNLIHRDVSPPNILLGYNGDVKITDFGLVKSKSQISKTVPGLIKGKFSYLSPEAAYGESIDLRSDIYAVGIVLWEMLTSRPLFVDPVEMKILDLVRKSIVPSVRAINPEVPASLEAILMKGLARDRAKRYQSAKAFADDLRGFLDSMGNPPSELGKIVASIKPPEGNETDNGAQANPTQGSPDERISADDAPGASADRNASAENSDNRGANAQNSQDPAKTKVSDKEDALMPNCACESGNSAQSENIALCAGEMSQNAGLTARRSAAKRRAAQIAVWAIAIVAIVLLIVLLIGASGASS